MKIKSILMAALLSVSMLAMPVVVEAKPAKDSYGTDVHRVSLVEAKNVWNQFLDEGGLYDALYNDYGVYGLMYYVENPKTGEIEERVIQTGIQYPDELTREWDCVEYLSHDDRYDRTVFMIKDRSNNTADAYLPGTAMF